MIMAAIVQTVSRFHVIWLCLIPRTSVTSAVNLVGLVCFGIAVILTVISGVNYIYKNREILKK